MFLTHSAWLNLLIIIGLVGGAEEVVRRLIGKPIVRAWLKVEKFLDTWNGEPARDGLAARPGLVDRVIAIEYQVHNNGGGSMKDAVDAGVRIAGQSLDVARETQAALDQHVKQSGELIDQGAKDKEEILARQDAQDHTISTLAEAVKIAAQSTPPKETL